jgi:hypothetical protein
LGLTEHKFVVRITIALGVALVVAIAIRVTTDPSPVATQKVVAIDGRKSDLVTRADFEGRDPASPGAIVLRWWQANQVQNPKARRVDSFYAVDSRTPNPRLRADMRITRYIFQESKPLILDERTDGDSAEVFTLIPPPRDDAGSDRNTPYVFALRRKRGDWKLSDSFLADRAAGERRFARERRGR